MVRQLLHGIEVFGPNRLLQPERIVGFDLLGHANRALHLEIAGVDIDSDVDVRPHRFANSADSLTGDTGHLVIGHGVVAPIVRRHLDGGVSVFVDEPGSVLGRLFRRRAANTLVGADLVANAASEQSPHRQAGGFGGNVPQGVFDAAHGCSC